MRIYGLESKQTASPPAVSKKEKTFSEISEIMIENLPIVKGLPENLGQKLQERKTKYERTKDEWHKVRIEYLKEKIKQDVLLDISLFLSGTNLPPILMVSPENWTGKVQNALLNGKGKVLGVFFQAHFINRVIDSWSLVTEHKDPKL